MACSAFILFLLASISSDNFVFFLNFAFFIDSEHSLHDVLKG